MNDSQNKDAIPEPESAASAASHAAAHSSAKASGFEEKGGDKKKAPSDSLILKTVVVFYTIISIIWVFSAWSGKRPLYSSGPTLRRVGETYAVEITLIREDRRHLACASEQVFSGLRCAYKKPKVDWSDPVTDDKLLLRPYSTVEGEQMLAAGLWAQLPPYEKLPTYRFSALCSFHALGAVRNAQARWNVNSDFGPVNRVWFVGSLSNCIIPK
jgi:hypothetical protein